MSPKVHTFSAYAYQHIRPDYSHLIFASKHVICCLFCLQVPGLVNVDFADVRSVMSDAGSSLMGIGTATG
jgi:hypothetical protein